MIFIGLDLMIEHIQTWITITYVSIEIQIGVFRFELDKTPHVTKIFTISNFTNISRLQNMLKILLFQQEAGIQNITLDLSGSNRISISN